MIVLVPFDRVQAATASPDELIAMAPPDALWPGSERFTGVDQEPPAGLLVACYITLEAPLSGMSMNPARSFGPALLAGTAGSLWIYFTAPLAGMLAAAELFVRVRGRRRVRCAKLHHPLNVRCIFNCGFMETPA